MNFFKKFFELQLLMIQHNAGLTDSHPYASGPISWPFLVSGISFWTGNGQTREQIYLIGNFTGWWFCVLALSVFVGILGAEQLARRRGIQAVPEREQDTRVLVLHNAEWSFFCRCTQPPVQHGWILPSRLGIPLWSFLDDESPALPAPVSFSSWCHRPLLTSIVSAICRRI